MARRIRSIKPEWSESESLGSCSDAARVLSVSLINVSDDYGNGRAHPGYLTGVAWCYQPDTPAAKAECALAELARIGFVELYDVRGQSYFHMPGWQKHQRVDNAGKPGVPGPSDPDAVGRGIPPKLAATPDASPEVSPLFLRKGVERDQEGSGVGGESEGESSPKAARPAAKRRRVPMPTGWAPDEAAKTRAVEFGLDVGREADDFREWTTAKAMTYADWNAGFRSHLASQAKRARPGSAPAVRDRAREIWEMAQRMEDT